jgi:hypothetical protein
MIASVACLRERRRAAHSVKHGFIVLLSSDARNLAIRHMVRALRDG